MNRVTTCATRSLVPVMLVPVLPVLDAGTPVAAVAPSNSRSGAPGWSPRVTRKHGSLVLSASAIILHRGMAAAQAGAERERGRERPVAAQLPGHVGAGRRGERAASEGVKGITAGSPPRASTTSRSGCIRSARRGHAASRRPCGIRRPLPPCASAGSRSGSTTPHAYCPSLTQRLSQVETGPAEQLTVHKR